MNDIHIRLSETVALLKQLPPVPVAIWVIDRPAWYYRFIDLLPPAKIYPHYNGIPVYRWSLSELEERVESLQEEGWSKERIERVLPFRYAGVWVEMNKGPHLKLDEGGI
jgi:hypothetical protein